MGNSPSNLSTFESEDIWWKNGNNEEVDQEVETIISDISTGMKDSHEDFVEEFDRKREKRKLILEEKRKEIQDMREELRILREENDRLRNTMPNVQDNSSNAQIEFLLRQNQSFKDEIESMKDREKQTVCLLDKNKELRISVSEMQSELQKLNSCVLDFEQEKDDYRRHVTALKDVIKVSKELLLIRENELQELKQKMEDIERSFNDRETSVMSNDLRREYERQLTNIRTLRVLYEERSQTYRRETTLLRSTIVIKEKEIDDGVRKLSELQERIDQLDKENSDKYDTIKSLESNLGLARAESRQYQAELAVINQLFSHILLAFNNSPDLDLDKLLKQLEEHHDLLKNIVNNEISSEVSSVLPKVLLDLVNKISSEDDQTQPDTELCDDKKLPNIPEGNESTASALHNLNSPAEIAENLPKVWKVLIELLSHQSACTSDHEDSEAEDENRCFKTIVTPKGPSLVLSVSKTFFRLKELIIEKKTLEKDMSNLKQLNSHLESRLQDQEKRFEVVSSELSKTWNFVGKLQKEHQLLHTQEQILRYELAQKRKLLKQLREELEYSREKWQEAREKNSKTEKEWLILRKEFAARKKTNTTEDGNNSVESGYSDEREGLSDEEPGYETDISECNLKIDETCENESEVSELPTEICDAEEPCDIPDDIPRSQEGSLSNKQNDELVDSSTSKSEYPILNVIQKEITVISQELSCSIHSGNNASTSTLPQNENLRTEGNTIDEDGMEKYLAEETKEKPSCSSSSSTKILEERLAARDERLKRLEGQCKALVSQVTNTSNRSVAICSKLEDLHELYGENSRNSQRNQNNEEEKTEENNEENEQN